MISLHTIRLHPWCNLIVFSFCLIFSCCKQPKKDSSQSISLVWNGNRAVAVVIPLNLLPGDLADSIKKKLIVQRIPAIEKESIAGEYEIKENHLIFTPLIPFTRGLHYQVSFNDKLLSELIIPSATESPEVIAIYPGMDSLPENLLKFYIRFSKPMAEGHAHDFVMLKNERGDTLQKIFLNLDPELWNENGTVLTLWLDPGRIKRDLQPNKLLGSPLKKGERYTLVISADWPDQEGGTLKKKFTKFFLVCSRDSISPSPENWSFTIPKALTTYDFVIDFHEPLDYFLANHTIHILNDRGDSLQGKASLSEDQQKFYFIPQLPWTRGKYHIQVENILEDLAGNNLNRPFDRDLSDKNVKTNDNRIFEREFVIP